MNVTRWHLLLKLLAAELQMERKESWKFNPTSLHERTPIFIGSEYDVKMVEEFMKKEEVNNDVYIGNKS